MASATVRLHAAAPVWLACGFASGSQPLIAARPIDKPPLQEAAGRLGCNVVAIYHDERASVAQRLIIDGLSRETHAEVDRRGAFMRWEGRLAEQHANSDAPGSPQPHAMHRPACADGQITYSAAKVI